MLVVAGSGTPSRSGAGDGQVVEAALDEGDQFVAAGFGVDVAFVGVEFEELVAIAWRGGRSRILLRSFDFGAGGDGVALAVADFGFRLLRSRLHRVRVPAGVLCRVEMSPFSSMRFQMAWDAT